MNGDPSNKATSNLEKWLKLKKKKQGQSDISLMPVEQKPLLSHGQERLWFLDKLNPESVLYNYAHRYDIKGDFNSSIFKESLDILSKRHEILRTNFRERDGVPELFVHDHRSIPLSEVDLSNLPGQTKAKELTKRTGNFVLTPFDLVADVLIKFILFKLDEKQYQLVLVIHHIIGDRWSLNILHKEISAIYQALLAHRRPALQPLAIQYKDYAYWQRKKGTDLNSLKFWSEKLDQDQILPALPYDQKKPLYTTAGATYVLEWSSHFSNELKKFAQAQGVTLYVLLLSIYHVLLYRYSRTDCILVGTPFSNRDKPILEHLIGFFNETVVIGAEIDPAMSFLQLLQQVNQSVREAMTHKDVPFELLVNTLTPNRYAGENPLFNTMFLFNAEAQTTIFDPNLDIDHRAIDLEVAKFDLTLFISEKVDRLQLALEYSKGLFTEDRIKSISTHYQILTKSILSDPSASVTNLDLISESEKELILNNWNTPLKGRSSYTTILELFAQRTKEQPDQLAVAFEDHKLSYEELDIWSDQLATKLLNSNVQNGDFVGIYTPRSLEMIVGILGVLKTGAAYLPLDPEYPPERIKFMMIDAAVTHVLYHPDTVPNRTDPSIISIEISPASHTLVQSLRVIHTGQDIAYLIYTSGSSGEPKGVMVTHENLLFSTLARDSFYKEPMRSFLLLSSFSFDSSIVGIFWSISKGGTLVIPPSRIEQDTEKLGQLIERFKVSHTLLLPSLYATLLEYIHPEQLDSLSTVILAGEACSSKVVQHHFKVIPGVNLYNEYGPTEATVWCVAHKILPNEASYRVPIGKPIQYTQAYILDAELRLVPPGIKGELYIGGVGVTAGYLNRPTLNVQRFLANPFDHGLDSKIYKTGDLAAYRSDGTIDFYGRTDNQIKIRGYRVELDEIKTTVLTHPDVTDAIVQVSGSPGSRNQNKQIVAHITGEAPIIDDLMAFLRTRLPSYMVPRLIIFHETFPRLPNGKIDHTSLSNVIVDDQDLVKNEVSLSKTEKILQDIWKETLRLKQVDIDDNFFEIGGDSILSIQIVAKARKANLQLGTDQIFRFQSIRELARQLDHGQNPPQFDKQKLWETVKSEAMSLPLSKQQKAFYFHRLQEANDQGFLQLEFQIEGDLESELFVKAWEKTLTLHPVMRTSFHWPTDEEAYQVVHRHGKLSWTIKNWKGKTGQDKQQAWVTYKEKDQARGLDLENAPVSRMTLIEWKENYHKFLWTCHHILLDGWSAGIILEDVLTVYHSLNTGVEPQLEMVPSYLDFLEWKRSQDIRPAKDFWSDMFTNYFPVFDWEKMHQTGERSFEDLDFKLSLEQSSKLVRIARDSRITSGLLMQGLWLIALSKVLGTSDLVFGITSSGRSGSFHGSHRMTGLYMNVLPARVIIDQNQKLGNWLIELQNLNTELRKFEYVDLDQIQGWINPSTRLPSLFVFGNFLKEGLKIGDLCIQDYFGEFSSSHPITIRINPLSEIEVSIRSDRSSSINHYVHALVRTYHELMLHVTQESMQQDISKVQSSGRIFPLETSRSGKSEGKNLLSTYREPENATHLELIRIWEDVLDHKPMGISDNYFDLGGSSLLAIRMFSRIRDKFNKFVSPAVLLEHPTIAQLASYLDGGISATPLEAIVPLKSSGQRPPLFCIHSGGAHVFFYKNLAKYIHDDQPLYAIRPKGLSDDAPFHDTIENMASHYITQIRQVQPDGPYFLLGTCFSNAVGLEMCHQLTSMNQEVGTLIIVDSGPAHLQPPTHPGTRKPLRRMLSMMKKGNWYGIRKKFRDRYSRFVGSIAPPGESETDLKLKEMIHSLNNLYINYIWKPYAGKIFLIRSSEFSARRDKQFHVDQWSVLAEGQLAIEVVEGHHITLFEEPEVKNLAEKISSCLRSN